MYIRVSRPVFYLFKQEWRMWTQIDLFTPTPSSTWMWDKKGASQRIRFKGTLNVWPNFVCLLRPHFSSFGSSLVDLFLILLPSFWIFTSLGPIKWQLLLKDLSLNSQLWKFSIWLWHMRILRFTFTDCQNCFLCLMTASMKV